MGSHASLLFWFKKAFFHGLAGSSQRQFCKCRGMQWEVKCSEESPDCHQASLNAPPLASLSKAGHLPIDILI